MYRIVLTCLILAACAEVPEVAAPKAPSYRDAGAPMGSVALFDPARFAGDWEIVAEFPGPEAACAPKVRWVPAGPGYVRERCDGVAEARALAGPGRFTGSGAAPIWVLWVDEGYRTAVIGTPNGQFGRILNRGRPIPTDRYRAAVEILDFNGYDTSGLLEVDP